MSSTRKIEGYADIYGPEQGIAADFYMSKEFAGDTSQVAVLIIGGNALTEEEHEAEFQRRAKAMLADLKDQTMSMAVEQSIDRIAAKHGIKS